LLSSLPANIAQQLQSNPHYARWQYFYQKRAFPNGSIPPGALQAARQDFSNKWGMPPGVASANQNVPANQPPAANQWTSIGPTPIGSAQFGGTASGRVNAVAIHPTNTSIIYIGAADGGVWKTTDGGNTWTPLTDGQCSLSMGALAIDPVNPNIVYAGTGEQNFSLDSYYGCGVLRSADGGQTWTQLGASAFGGPNSFGTPSMSRVLIDPVTAGSTTTTTLLVSADTGVYRSTNSGAIWTNVLAGTATDLVRDPSTPATIYAALGNTGGAVNNGVYKSTDGGQTWTQLSGGFPTANVGRINIGIAASSPQTVYASVQNSSSSPPSLFGQLLGIWKTTNGGTGWTQVSATNATCDAGAGGQCWYDMYVYVDPTNANTVYFSAEDLFKSADGGSTFTDIGGYTGGIHPDQHGFAFQPGNPSTIVVGNDGGVFKSTNGGTTWSSLNQNLTLTQFYTIAVTPDGSKVLGGTQDNGTNLYSGSTTWVNILGGDGGFTAIDFNTPTTAYGEFPFADPQITTNLGASASWTDISTGLVGNNPLFIAPLVMSPTNSHTLYSATQYLNKTTNQGTSWSQIGTPGTAGFNPGNDPISAVAEAQSNSQVVYSGTSGFTSGQSDVQVTTNGGTAWTDIRNGLPNRYVSYIAINPTNSQIAFVTFQGFGTGHVFQTTNAGTNWTDISANLPNIPVNFILLNPRAPTRDFFVGTDLGVFRSTNGGSSWAPYQAGLPNVVVEDLVYSNGTLLAGTHGRGAWKATIPGPLADTHDFNGDGKSDIAWRDTSGDVALWLMNGAVVTSSGGVGGVPGTFSIVGQRDFNGDGKADLLWRDTSGNTSMWFMNGTTAASTASVGNIPSNWSVAGVADFNGDGMGDLLWRDSSGNIAVWLMSSATVMSSAALGNVPTTWTAAGTGDFNGDGMADILWRDNLGNTAIWFMNGTTVASTAGVGNIPTNWSVVGTGDFNGDGKADIVWRDTAGNTSIWLMNGAAVLTAGALGNIPTTWSIVQTGDYNGDGMSDLIWRDTSGNTSMWFMNGAAVSSTAGVGNIPTNWTVQSTNAE
jgi:photosystem II stability/assembly factor-like uncharacterized protein